MRQEFPILEFDPDKHAIINPQQEIKAIDIPERCVICFFQDVIHKLNLQQRLTKIADQKSEIGKHPVYVLEFNGQQLALYHPGVGAPLCAGLLEEVIARGCQKFIVVGSAGVLDSSIARGHVLVPTAAVRDEGTSYHYLPPSREVAAHPRAVQAIETVLKRNEIDYLLTKTWTTDAFYRETPGKIALRKSEGCLTVEMEAAALFAVAQFRNVILGQILYSGDDVGGKEWNSRKWTKDKELRERFFWLAAEACLEL
ncbi:MAG: nucleoside phosphorylase [candidate division KSB1 bacterium]|nr:nucleoside phosphorylase [candidate division KSB1 bacterium]